MFPPRFVHGRFTQFVAISLRRSQREQRSLRRCPGRAGQDRRGLSQIGGPENDKPDDDTWFYTFEIDYGARKIVVWDDTNEGAAQFLSQRFDD
jgi:hypothetical protein